MMNWFELAGSILFSVLSAGGLLFALSSWLGKVWASRILEHERHELSVLKETFLKEHGEKIMTYKTVIDVVSKILADLDKWKLADSSTDRDQKIFHSLNQESFHTFNEQRLRVYGYLGIIAPQAVMDAEDRLMEQILLVANGKEIYEWQEIRRLALVLINEIRKDIAIDKTPISYNGTM